MATAAQKMELLEQAKAHFAADMLLQGTYGREKAESFKGCSVGCHVHHIKPGLSAHDIDDLANKHRIVADHYGYPEWLALLQDTIFEGLPNGESAKWHVQLAEALATLPDDHDWQATLHRVHVAILRVSHRNAGSAQEVVQRVIDLHERAGQGEDISDELWSAARSAARSAAAEAAAWSAARSAARSAAAEAAAWSAARSAAWSAAWSAAEAAWSAAEAAWSAARSAARSAAYQEMRDAILAALPAAS